MGWVERAAVCCASAGGAQELVASPWLRTTPLQAPQVPPPPAPSCFLHSSQVTHTHRLCAVNMGIISKMRRTQWTLPAPLHQLGAGSPPAPRPCSHSETGPCLPNNDVCNHRPSGHRDAVVIAWRAHRGPLSRGSALSHCPCQASLPFYAPSESPGCGSATTREVTVRARRRRRERRRAAGIGDEGLLIGWAATRPWLAKPHGVL